MPGGVAGVVDTFSVDDPEVVTDAGVNTPVAPEGRPVTLKATVPVNPFAGVTVAVYDVLPPGATVPVAGVSPSQRYR